MSGDSLTIAESASGVPGSAGDRASGDSITIEPSPRSGAISGDFFQSGDSVMISDDSAAPFYTDPPSDASGDPAGRPPADAIASITRRGRTAAAPRPGPRFEYCQTPPQAHAALTRRSATSRSFERSQTPSAVFNPSEMYYRERDLMERAEKRRFDGDRLRRSKLEQAHSPYRYQMIRHRDYCQRKFREDSAEYEHASRRERNRDTIRYRATVREAKEHEAHLVKMDFFVPADRAVRILAL
jgi:hypothetical protein